MKQATILNTVYWMTRAEGCGGCLFDNARSAEKCLAAPCGPGHIVTRPVGPNELPQATTPSTPADGAVDGLPGDFPGPSQNGESDPTGKGAHEKGAKLDAGKQRTGIVLGAFSRSLSAVADVGTFGANKYTKDGWVSVPNGIERYTDAMLRHYLKESSGESLDPDSNLTHAAHLAWNALARLDLMLRDRDDAA